MEQQERLNTNRDNGSHSLSSLGYEPRTGPTDDFLPLERRRQRKIRIGNSISSFGENIHVREKRGRRRTTTAAGDEAERAMAEMEQSVWQMMEGKKKESPGLFAWDLMNVISHEANMLFGQSHPISVLTSSSERILLIRGTRTRLCRFRGRHDA
jgi:hypothetical protein